MTPFRKVRHPLDHGGKEGLLKLQALAAELAREEGRSYLVVTVSEEEVTTGCPLAYVVAKEDAPFFDLAYRHSEVTPDGRTNAPPVAKKPCVQFETDDLAEIYLHAQMEANRTRKAQIVTTIGEPPMGEGGAGGFCGWKEKESASRFDLEHCHGEVLPQ